MAHAEIKSVALAPLGWNFVLHLLLEMPLVQHNTLHNQSVFDAILVDLVLAHILVYFTVSISGSDMVIFVFEKVLRQLHTFPNHHFQI